MEKSMSVWKRLLAVLMVFALVIGYVPMGVAAEEATETDPTPAAMTTSITEGMVFAVNETTYFTYGTVPNDDASKMVKGRFEITNEDGSAVNMAEIAKLEYLEVQTGNWFEFYGDFGPVDTGFPMMEATSSFRITFKQEGTYKVTVSMVAMEDGSVLCSDLKTVKAEKVASAVTINGLTAATAGLVTDFSVTTDANSDSGAMVLGSFAVKQDGADVSIADVAKLEYLESQTGTWYEIYGDFGPAATGFPMADATSNFRVTFLKTGNYDVQVFVKPYGAGNDSALCTASATVNVAYPAVTFSGVEEGKWYGADQTVTVSVAAPGLTDAAQLPEVSVTESCGTVGAWVKGEDGTWTNEVTVTASATVSSNGSEVKVQIDKTKPDVNDKRTMIWFSRKDGSSYARVYFTVGTSGLQSVIINGQEYTDFEVNRDGSVTVKLNGYVDGWTANVQVKSNSDLISGDTVVNDEGPIGVKITYSGEALERKNDKGEVIEVYLDADTQILLTVSNVDDPSTENGLNVDKTTVNGKNVSWTYDAESRTATAVLTLAENEEVNGIKLHAEDKRKHSREADCETSVKFIYDVKNPVLNVTANVEATTEYFNGVAEYTFAVSDEHMTKGVADLNLEYVLEVNGEEQGAVVVPMDQWGYAGNTYSHTVKVENAKLVSYTVTGHDNINNPIVAGSDMNSTVAAENGFVYDGHKLICDTIAPTAKVTFSENVTGIFARGGKVYLQLGDAIDNDNANNAEAVEVEVTVTFIDRNLTMANTAVNIDGDTGEWSGVPEENKESALVYTKKITVAADEAGVLELDLTLFDKVNIPVEKVYVQTVNGNSYPFDIIPENGQVNLSFNFDRRRPTSTEGSEGEVDTNLPEIIIENKVLPVYTAGEFELFNAAPTFSFSVNDGTPESGNSGLAKVTWELVDPNGFVIADGDEETWEIKEDKEAVYAYASEITAALNGNNESNEVTLRITVVDAGGNAISRAKTFGVDTLGPRINVSYDNNDVSNGFYFNADRKVIITADDINYVDMTVTFDGIESKISEITTDKVFTEGEHTFSVVATDKAGNPATIIYAEGTKAANEFIIDKTPAVITVTKILEEGASLVNSYDGIDYHNGQVTYKVDIADKYLDSTAPEGGVNSADLIATFEDGTGSDVEISLAGGWTVSTGEDGLTHYTADVIVQNGGVLTGIAVSAKDNANNPSTVIKCDDENTNFVYLDSVSNAHVYTGTVVVDMECPYMEVLQTVEEGKQFVQTYGGVDYYDGKVTYTVTVGDMCLNENVGAAELVVTFADGEVNTYNLFDYPASEEENTLISEFEEYKVSFDVVDGKTLTNISIQVIDNAGHGNYKTISGGDADRTDFAYDADTKTWTYTGNPVVVDTVAPEATLTFSDNVETFFVRNNTVYLELTKPVEAESGAVSDAAAEVVTVTIDATDLNLAIDDVNEHGVYANDPFEWKGDTPVNEETTVTYIAKSAEVKPDGTAVFMIDVKVSDLAGNHLTSFKSNLAADDKTYLPVDVDEEGAIKYAFSLDRMRPTSAVSDTNAPTITIDPSIDPTKTADGLDLFSGAFKFDLNVTDGEDSKNNSGLKYVKWTVNDENGIVAAVDVTNSYENGADVEISDAELAAAEPVFSGTYSIDVALAGAQGRQESNEVTLNIEAMDNVGNLITFSKTFGVDAQAPEVVIETEHGLETCNVHAGIGHEYYFNENQTIQITITDLNFDATSSPVTSIEVTDKENVAFSGWTNQGGNVWTGSLSYTTDGDYTFNVESTDLANHAAEFEIEPYVAKFTIDKTAPVIHVNFNPFVPVDTDGDMVQYFDENRTVTVTIDEHNFRATDVKADLGAANALGAWATVGDNHTATDVFTEGNNYYVKVEYTDLAGNAAAPYNSPKFSVDLHAPEIEINKGSMSTGTLNIVPDDLILGFSITDHQDNLKNFHVEVIHLDNSYNQTKVEGVEYYSVTDGDRTTGYIDFTNIASEKANDGIYTVRVTALDYAGHQVNYPDVVFSLNRFGSTFVVNDDYTSDFLTAGSTGIIYQNEVTDQLVITEINPNRVWQDADQTVEGSTITVAANGSSVTLVPGEDYEVTVTEKGNGNNKWFEYTYAINPEVFNRDNELVDGEYTMFFYSEDEAGNKNTNESNEGSELLLGSDGNYSGKLTFTLDHKAPVVTVLNIEEGGQYVEANRNVDINISDNTPVSIAVYINDELVEFVETAEGQPLNSDWLTYDAASGNYVLNMSEKDEVQNVRVVVTDAAGNVYEETIGDITLTENLWIQFTHNEVLVICSIVGLIGLIILIILLLKKRKKKEEETAAV